MYSTLVSRGMKAVIVVLGIGAMVVWVAPHHVRAGGHENEDPLHDAMEDMGDAYRELRRTVGDADRNVDSFKQLLIMQKAVLIALPQVPHKTEILPKEERSRFVLDYKKNLVGLLTAILDIEDALLASDNEKAKQIHRKMATRRREAHAKFQEEE